jgi:hypothetical protein
MKLPDAGRRLVGAVDQVADPIAWLPSPLMPLPEPGRRLVAAAVDEVTKRAGGLVVIAVDELPESVPAAMLPSPGMPLPERCRRLVAVAVDAVAEPTPVAGCYRRSRNSRAHRLRCCCRR